MKNFINNSILLSFSRAFMIIINQTKDGMTSLPGKEIPMEHILTSTLARRILRHLSSSVDYPRHTAQKLGAHEQNVYYHIRLLTRAGFLKRVADPKSPMGYSFMAAEPAFVVRLSPFRTMQKLEGLQKESRFLEPFVSQGRLDAKIIVGSPDPHGPHRARSRDGYYGIDFALFLGSFIHYVPESMVKLDTEIRREELSDNLIVFGGPIVNRVMARLNEHLPIRFLNSAIYSTASKQQYEDDACAMIIKAPNPFARGKHVLAIAGIRHAGTRAAIIAFLKHFDQVKLPNKHNQKFFGHVVEGIDMDSDGIVDEVEFLE